MTSHFFLPADGFCVSVIGSDAASIVNNLSTQDLAGLGSWQAAESFVTNIRGWVVAHVVVVRLEDKLLLLGRHPDPQKVGDHIDRYIIREDAEVALEPEMLPTVIVDPEKAWFNEKIEQAGSREGDNLVSELEISGTRFYAVPAPFSGGDAVLIPLEGNAENTRSALGAANLTCGEPVDLELARIKRRWPLQEREIGEKTIPQELARDTAAISFTKGCYLGQETIARLDARGQLQKRLGLLQIALSNSGSIEPGLHVIDGEKQVGVLSSVESDGSYAYGLAMLKRGSFETGSKLKILHSDKLTLDAEVIEPLQADLLEP